MLFNFKRQLQFFSIASCIIIACGAYTALHGADNFFNLGGDAEWKEKSYRRELVRPVEALSAAAVKKLTKKLPILSEQRFNTLVDEEYAKDQGMRDDSGYRNYAIAHKKTGQFLREMIISRIYNYQLYGQSLDALKVCSGPSYAALANILPLLEVREDEASSQKLNNALKALVCSRKSYNDGDTFDLMVQGVRHLCGVTMDEKKRA